MAWASIRECHRSFILPGVTRLSEGELAEMRELASRGWASCIGSISTEFPEDFPVQLQRSEIARWQELLRRAADELEALYASRADSPP
jgi:hypothetical protein